MKKIKWLIRELVKVYSNEESYFSKKRLESGLAFFVAEWGSIFFLIMKYKEMSGSDFGIWAAIQFGVAGYIINQIQKEKTN